MFFNFFKKYTSLLLLTLILFPTSSLAASKYLIAGGDNIGIEIKTPGVIVVGTYDHHSRKSDLKAGDIITKVDDKKISSIKEMVNIINESKNQELEIEYERNNKTQKTILSIYNDNGVFKTGLYVKDSVTGIGTLTYIDPENKTFGALGHEIVEKNTGEILEVKEGTIFNSDVVNVEKSEIGVPGSKTAQFYTDQVRGEITENTVKGIFGNYTGSIDSSKLYKVADINDIELGKATIRTVLENNTIGEYEINILKINADKDSNKNILFEITDEELLNKTGGVVQGMSGSTIIQGEYIIGAVNFVLVDNPIRGYGIFIKNMLEEAEK